MSWLSVLTCVAVSSLASHELELQWKSIKPYIMMGNRCAQVWNRRLDQYQTLTEQILPIQHKTSFLAILDSPLSNLPLSENSAQFTSWNMPTAVKLMRAYHVRTAREEGVEEQPLLLNHARFEDGGLLVVRVIVIFFGVGVMAYLTSAAWKVIQHSMI